MQDNNASNLVESLIAAEEQAFFVLKEELSRHARLNELAFNVIGMVVNKLPELPVADVSPSRKVTTNLLVSVSNNIRSANLLALRGYAVQAASLVASIYEMAFCIAAIGSDDTLAQQWINHDDPTRAFQDVRSLTRAGLVKIGVPDPDLQTSLEYRVYRQLCMAKHSNPLFQMQQGFQLQGTRILAVNGPDTSEVAIRAAWFALEHATSLAFVALVSFVSNHISSEDRDDLMQHVMNIGASRKELAALGKARWGTKDPFPGKWRT